MNTKTTNKLKKITAIGFITLFAAFLAIPNTGILNEKENTAIVAKENRKITAFPQTSTTTKKFYTEFEKWYQDRLRYRDKIISLWKQSNFNFGVILKDNIVLGKNDWLFNTNNCLKFFKEPNEKIKRIKSLQNYCQKNGMDFILMVPPNKESVYRDYFPENIKTKYKNPKDWQKQAERLFTKNKINYLSVTKQIENQRKIENQDLYFNDDHHWSYYASSTAADLLMNKLEKDLHKEFYQGLKFDGTAKKATKEYSYANQLGLKLNRDFMAPWSKKYTNELYLTDSSTGKTRKISNVISNNVMWSPMLKGEGTVTNKFIKNNIKVLILGDSYSSYMVPYLSQNINQITSTHYSRVAGNKKEVNMNKLINKYKPNAVVLIINEATFFHSNASYLFKMLKF